MDNYIGSSRKHLAVKTGGIETTHRHDLSLIRKPARHNFCLPMALTCNGWKVPPPLLTNVRIWTTLKVVKPEDATVLLIQRRGFGVACSFHAG